MGSSREMAIAALAEPVLLLAFFVPIVTAGSSNLPILSRHGPTLVSAQGLLAFAALFVVTVAETGRIPVDNPDTHLELTMVHEGMILEAAGPESGPVSLERHGQAVSAFELARQHLRAMGSGRYIGVSAGSAALRRSYTL